jgi:hypothetical protein
MLDTFWDLGQEILLQEFVAESRRARPARAGHRRPGGGGHAPHRRAPASSGSNIHRGGKARAVTLPREYAEAAVKAARVIGLEVAGVDMLESRGGPQDHGGEQLAGLRGAGAPPEGTSPASTSSTPSSSPARARPGPRRGAGVARALLRPNSIDGEVGRPPEVGRMGADHDLPVRLGMLPPDEGAVHAPLSGRSTANSFRGRAVRDRVRRAGGPFHELHGLVDRGIRVGLYPPKALSAHRARFPRPVVARAAHTAPALTDTGHRVNVGVEGSYRMPAQL